MSPNKQWGVITQEKVGGIILTISWVLSSLVAVGLVATSRLRTSDFVKGWVHGWRGLRDWALTSLPETRFRLCQFYFSSADWIFIYFLPYTYYLKLSVSQFIYRVLKVPFKHRHAILSQGSQWVEVQYSDILKLSPCKITHWIIDTQPAMRRRDRRQNFNICLRV